MNEKIIIYIHIIETKKQIFKKYIFNKQKKSPNGDCTILSFPLHRCLYQPRKHRMWSQRTRDQFWMKLCPYHIRMPFHFHNLRQFTVRTRP